MEEVSKNNKCCCNKRCKIFFISSIILFAISLLAIGALACKLKSHHKYNKFSHFKYDKHYTDKRYGDYDLDKKKKKEDYRVSFVEGYVKKAASAYNKKGLTAFFDGSFPSFINKREGGTYIFVIDLEKNKLVLNAGNPERSGLSIDEATNASGENVIKEHIIPNANEEGVWVSYIFNNPKTGVDESKRSFVKKQGNLIFGAGLYENNKRD